MKRFLVFCFLLISSCVFSQITAQWRGPARDGIYPGGTLLQKWPDSGPIMLWSTEGIGKGFSSPVMAGSKIYVTGQKDTMDVLTCLGKDGSILWQQRFGQAWAGSVPGTRTTPTIDGTHIYVISGNGIVACLDAGSGSVVWSLDGISTFKGVNGTWGVSESPLIVEDKLIYTPAGEKTTIVALDKNTGKTLWMSESLNDTSAYVSPRLISCHGRGIIVTLTERWFFGVDPGNGKILWKYDYASLKPEKGLKIWPGAPRTNTITPLFSEDMIYITGGYDHVGAMFRLSPKGDSITRVWVDSTLDCHHGGVVKIGNYIYGSNWIDNSKGKWCCIDWFTGKKMYEEKWFTKGAIISDGTMLYCIDEKDGNVGLVRATPEKFDLISSFKITKGSGPFWAHPSIYENILLTRHGGVVMAYDISGK
jgi:outer membrane protein assembly factor BamB